MSWLLLRLLLNNFSHSHFISIFSVLQNEYAKIIIDMVRCSFPVWTWIAYTHTHELFGMSLSRCLFNIHDQFNGKFNALFSARTGNMLPREYASHALHITIHLFMFTICCSLHVAVSNTFSQLITNELQLLRSDENSHLKWAQASAPNKNSWEQKKPYTKVYQYVSIHLGLRDENAIHQALKTKQKIDEIKKNECFCKIARNWISKQNQPPTSDRMKIKWWLLWLCKPF